MEEKIPENSVLDFAFFRLSSVSNSYEALITSNGITEKLAHGPLDQLAVHLPTARSSTSYGSFKLQLDGNIEASAWFTKFIVGRFLHVVNVPNALKLVIEIENAILQLEETKRFHISLYEMDNSNHLEGGEADINCLNEAGLTQQVKVETPSDAIENDFLRAFELRLSTLTEELAAAFNCAVGAICSSFQISDLAKFSHHFGAIELRDSLLKFLELCPSNLPFDNIMKQLTLLNASGNIKQETKNRSLAHAKSNVFIPVTTSISPAKVALVERQSSSDSEDCSVSSDGDDHIAERRRPLVRFATPRSQSGSRMSTSVNIKSLNYFSSREKATANREADASESKGKEMEHLPKKPENSDRRMSVLDAVSLFEGKQKDYIADIHNGSASEVSISANKAVLQRWSAETSDAINLFVQENASGSEEKKVNNVRADVSNLENTPIVSLETAREPLLQGDILTVPVATCTIMDSDDQACTSEWNVQKEPELNATLRKALENSKHSKYLGTKVENVGRKDACIDERRGLYIHYKEKRDEKLHAGKARNLAVKEAKSKVLHETLVQSNAAMPSKIIGAAVKQEAKELSPKQRRFATPVLSKSEVSTSTCSRKLPSKSIPNARSSLPSEPSKNVGGTLPAKSSSVSTGSLLNHQRYQPSTSYQSQPSPGTEKLPQPIKKDHKSVNISTSVNVQEGKKLTSVTSRSNTAKQISQTSAEDSGALSSKSCFQSNHVRKSSVVPLETKPFLRKGSGISSGIGHSIDKPKDSRAKKLSDLSKMSANHLLAGSTTKVMEKGFAELTNVGTDINIQSAESIDEDMGISSAAWTDAENQEYSPSHNNESLKVVYSTTIVPLISSTPLSQMVQVGNTEPDVIKWGDVENPSSMVYQKDASMGLERSLKFSQKGKVDGTLTGSSPLVLSGEEHESKSSSKRSSGTLQKSSIQTKSHAQTKYIVSECSNGGNFGKVSTGRRGVRDAVSGCDKLKAGHIATAKATRSLSTIRSSKASETKPR